MRPVARADRARVSQDVCTKSFFTLHGRSIPDKVNDELIRDSAQMFQNFNSPIDKVSFMVLDIPFLAKRMNQFVGFFQIVSWQCGEQMMIDLILQSSTEPIDKRLWESMSTRYIACRSNLQFPKVWTSISVVGWGTNRARRARQEIYGK